MLQTYFSFNDFIFIYDLFIAKMCFNFLNHTVDIVIIGTPD